MVNTFYTYPQSMNNTDIRTCIHSLTALIFWLTIHYLWSDYIINSVKAFYLRCAKHSLSVVDLCRMEGMIQSRKEVVKNCQICKAKLVTIHTTVLPRLKATAYLCTLAKRLLSTLNKWSCLQSSITYTQDCWYCWLIFAFSSLQHSIVVFYELVLLVFHSNIIELQF